MDRRHLLWPIAGLLLPLTGCLDERPSQMQDWTASPVTLTAPSRLSLTDCNGGEARFMLPVALTPVGQEVPPGWQGSGRLVNDYRVSLVKCERIAVGPFERGPIHVLRETHTDATPPSACTEFEPGFFNYELLRSFWLDDQEILAYLNSSLHMPTRLGAFGYSEVSEGAVAAYTWEWHAPDQPTSTIVFPKVETTPGGVPEVIRIFWHDGAGVSFFDNEEDTKQPLPNAPQTHGTLREPMMVGGTPFETNAGVYTLVEPGDYEGPIYRFGDLECKTPL